MPVQYVSALDMRTNSQTLTLVLSISTLNLLVHAFLHLPLQDSGSRRLVVFGYLKDVRRIDPVVLASAHDMVPFDRVFVDGNLIACEQSRNQGQGLASLTLL